MGSQFPKQTGIAESVNTTFGNAVDHHIGSTDLVKLAEQYPNELALYLGHDFTKNTADPITVQARLFQGLNHNKVYNKKSTGDKIKDVLVQAAGAAAEHFGMGSMFDDLFGSLKKSKPGFINAPRGNYPDADKFLTKFLTELSLYQVPQYDDSGNFTGVYNLLTEEFEKVDPEIEDNKGIDGKVKGATGKLSSRYGSGKMLPSNHQFAWYWVEKFQRAHHAVKAEYRELLRKNKVKDDEDYFTSISDSIGIIAKQTVETVNPFNIPLIDVDFTGLGDKDPNTGEPQLKETPNLHNPVTWDKLHPDMKLMLIDMTKKTQQLYRFNSLRLVRSFGSPAIAHGEDLNGGFGEAAHLRRMKEFQSLLEETVATTIGNAYALLLPWQWSKHFNQKVIASNPVVPMVTGSSLTRVDLLLNKIYSINPGTPKGARSEISANIPKNTTNHDVLGSD